MSPAHANSSSNKEQSSLVAFFSKNLLQKQEILPLATDASKKVIIFDLDGVLCKTNDLQAFYEIGIKVILQHMMQHGKPSVKKLFTALQGAPAITNFDVEHHGIKIPRIIIDWQCNKQGLRDVQDIMVKHILNAKLSIPEKNFMVQTILMMTTPRKFIETRQMILGALELAHTLKQLGYKLYILANWDATSFPLFKKKFPALFTYQDQDLFDGIMISGKTGMIKPDPKLFEALLVKFNIDRSQVVFIDDAPENVQAAQKLGISALHCRNYNIRYIKKELSKLLQA